jgi:solute carrier family 13 (sodium-dependent dicarboxylate transporter), member 2/3/5
VKLKSSTPLAGPANPGPANPGPAGKTPTMKNSLILILAFAAALTGFLIRIPEEATLVDGAMLGFTAQAALGVLLFALILWITEAVPFHITGLLALVLLAFFRVDKFTAVVAVGFGNHIVVFFIGVLILSAYITHSGLGRRISVFLLSRTGNSTALIILGFLVAGTLLSMWLTNMAVAAMLMPLGRAVLEEEGVVPLKSRFGKALMISICWGSIIGGIATPSGAGPNPLAIGFLKEMAGVEVNFIDWMMFGVPSALLLLLPVWGALLLFFPPEMKHLKKTKEELAREFTELPPMQREEKVTLVIFLATVILWVTSPFLETLTGLSLPISLPVILTGCLFFFPGVSETPWKKVESEINWSGILLVLTGISLGMMLYQTGAANWLSVLLLGGIGAFHPALQVFFVVLLVSFLKIAFSSNTVTATIIIPIMIALAQNVGIPPLTIAMPAALTASMAFILVTSSPTNVIPYSAGYFSIRDMAVAGVFITVIASVIVSLVIFGVGSLTGLY